MKRKRMIRDIIGEEVIPALTIPNKAGAASKEATAQLERYKNAYKAEFFTVLETCKEDMKLEFNNSPRAIAKIDKLTDEQMRDIAVDIGDQLEEWYWDAMREAVEAELEVKDSEPEK